MCGALWSSEGLQVVRRKCYYVIRAAALRNLNKGKAADLGGVKAEHLQAASDQLASLLNLLFMEMIQTGHTADVMKTGKKVLIPQKGKNDLLMPYNHGITITSTIGKTCEHIIKKRLSPLRQEGLPFGFSEGLSWQMPTVSLTDLISQAKDDKMGLHVIALDAEKAFHAMNNPIMLRVFQSCSKLPSQSYSRSILTCIPDNQSQIQPI